MFEFIQGKKGQFNALYLQIVSFSSLKLGQ